jgi:hypothetical protein
MLIARITFVGVSVSAPVSSGKYFHMLIGFFPPKAAMEYDPECDPAYVEKHQQQQRGRAQQRGEGSVDRYSSLGQRRGREQFQNQDRAQMELDLEDDSELEDLLDLDQKANQEKNNVPLPRQSPFRDSNQALYDTIQASLHKAPVSVNVLSSTLHRDFLTPYLGHSLLPPLLLSYFPWCTLFAPALLPAYPW